MRRTALLCLLTVAVLLTAGCQVRAEVVIDVVADGSGTVDARLVLDRAAARRLGDPSAVTVDDLRTAGWDVEDPVTEDDGTVVYAARRSFSGPDHLPLVLDEIGGRDGIFSEVEVVIDDGFGTADHELSARVRLAGSPEQFSDAGLLEALDGFPLARTPEDLAAAGADDPDAATLVVAVALPGDSLRTSGSIDGAGRASWTFPLTGGQPTDEVIRAASTTSRGRTGALVGVAVVGLVAAGAMAAVGLVRRRE